MGVGRESPKPNERRKAKKKIHVDSSQFTRVVTAYEFAAEYAKHHCVPKRGNELRSAKIVELRGEMAVELVFEREAHFVYMNEVCEVLGVAYALAGTYSDRKTQVLLGVGNAVNPDENK